jgi:cytochrome c oxidase subunit II
MRVPVLRSRGALAALLLLAFALLLAGCEIPAVDTGGAQSTLNPKGPNAAMIYQLTAGPIFIPAVIVFVVVEALLLFAIWKYRGKEGDPLPNQFHGNTTLEIGWTIIPALILIVILYFTWQTQSALATAPSSRDAVNVRVIGHQWWWEFEYPDLGVSTANELHIPVGVPVNVTLESVDVIHSFWVPLIAGKQDVIPGRVNRIWMQADEAGTYSAQCAEFCGVQHALMRFIVVAQSQSEFNSWAQSQRGVPGFGATPTAAGGQQSLVQQGAQLFANGACITCHTVRGTQAQGKVGPDLTHFGSRRTIGANTLQKDPEGANLKRWLRNPQAVKPGNLMPNLNLSEADAEAIAAYLESLK